MPVKLTTTITNISSLPTTISTNMKSIGAGNLKVVIYFIKFLGSDINFWEIHTRIKDTESDLIKIGPGMIICSE